MRRGSTVINGGVIVNTPKKILDGWDKIIGEKFFLRMIFPKYLRISKKS